MKLEKISEQKQLLICKKFNVFLLSYISDNLEKLSGWTKTITKLEKTTFNSEIFVIKVLKVLT